MAAAASLKAVILVGGPSSGTRFRPLSLNVPKPLFAVAGRKMLTHHLEALVKVDGLNEVLLLGFFEDGVFDSYMADMERLHGIRMRYLREERALGTAGGLSLFRDSILEGDPAAIFVVHCDSFCSFPLKGMLALHARHSGECTMLGTTVSKQEASRFGCLVVEEESRAVVHWAEKPETFVSRLVNAGLYLLAPSAFELVQAAELRRRERKRSSRVVDGELLMAVDDDMHAPQLKLENDVLMPLAGTGKLFLYETRDFWVSIKSPGMALLCSEVMLRRYREVEPDTLASGRRCTIVGDVFIHPTAVVHASAKLGPNVSIGADVVVGAGVRVANAIVLPGCRLREHCVVLLAIVGWNSCIGRWTRIEGSRPLRRDHNALSYRNVTILGVGVTAASEIVVRNSIVLPHKHLQESHFDEVLL